MNTKAAITAVKYACADMNISSPIIDFVDKDVLGSNTITGMYLPNHQMILFNIDWLAIAELEQVFLVGFHESRHWFQHHCILSDKERDNGTPFKIEQWRHDFNNYRRPDADFECSQAYIDQEIEKDAIQYSRDLFKKVVLNII